MERHDRPAVAFFYLDRALDEGMSFALDERVAHHAHVRRIAKGDDVAVTNGAGSIGLGKVTDLSKREIEVSIATVERIAPPMPLHLCAPVADRDRMLWLAEKATELGITAWQSVRFHRSSSVSPRGEGPAFGEKLRARMIGALEQSRGAWLPRILPDAAPTSVEDAGGLKLVLDVSGEPIIDLVSPVDGSVALLVGPEGGIENSERTRLAAAGWRAASLGSSTLRFETAAVAAVAIVRAHSAGNPSRGVSRHGQ